MTKKQAIKKGADAIGAIYTKKDGWVFYHPKTKKLMKASEKNLEILGRERA